MEEVPTQKEFEVSLTKWLRLQGKFIENASHGVIRYRSANEEPAEHVYWSKDDDGSRLECSDQLNRAEKEGKGVVSRQTGDPNRKNSSVLISYPLILEDSSTLTAAFNLQLSDETGLQRAMMQLQFGLNWLGECNREDGRNLLQSTANLVDLLHIDLSNKDSARNGMEIAASLAKGFSCEQVSICLQVGTRLLLLATSTETPPFKKSAIVDANIAACEECIDQNKTIVYPGAESDNVAIKHAHEKAARLSARKQVLSLPFPGKNGQASGVICLERSEDKPFNPQERQCLEQIAQIAGPTLLLQYTCELPLVPLISRRIREKFSAGILFASPLRKSVYLFILLCCLSLLFIKGDYLISAEGTVAGKIQRAIIAPFPGYLAEAFHRAGDNVKKGTLLAALDTDEITLQQLKWASLKAEKELEYRRAIAENLTAPGKIILEQKKQAEIQLKLLEMQKQRTKITAPFDGLLIKGDLSQTIGSPVDRGQMLFEIVPNETFRIHLDIDETDIGAAAVGQLGSLIVNALPSQKFQFTVDNITPVSTPQYGKNSFRVEGRLDSSSEQLSPGMKGYGKIIVSREPLLWIWSRPLITKLRLLLWSSTP